MSSRVEGKEGREARTRTTLIPPRLCVCVCGERERERESTIDEDMRMLRAPPMRCACTDGDASADSCTGNEQRLSNGSTRRNAHTRTRTRSRDTHRPNQMDQQPKCSQRHVRPSCRSTGRDMGQTTGAHAPHRHTHSSQPQSLHVTQARRRRHPRPPRARVGACGVLRQRAHLGSW